MPLPQQVINQLSREPAETPGWASSVILFSTMLFAIVIAAYLLMVFVYGPYLNNSLTAVQGQVATIDQSIASGDETNLVNFYSQIVNLRSVLGTHIAFSQFFDWLAANTEANVYYSQLSFASGNEITLSGVGRSESDVTQQIAIFESSPAVEKIAVSNVGLSNTNGLWTFAATLLMNPSLWASSSVASGTAPISPSP
jgi:hypothetical protein